MGQQSNKPPNLCRQIDRWIAKPINGQLDKQMEEWTDSQMDGRVNQLTNRLMDQQKIVHNGQ